MKFGCWSSAFARLTIDFFPFLTISFKALSISSEVLNGEVGSIKTTKSKVWFSFLKKFIACSITLMDETLSPDKDFGLLKGSSTLALSAISIQISQSELKMR